MDRNAGSLERAAAGSWSLGIVEQSQARAAVDCGETDGGDVRRRLWWEMPVEESQAAMEARQYC